MSIVVVMGVSGSGKSTVGVKLADRLGWPFVEGDSFHPAGNVAKMAAGQPLNDADRWPWLDSLGTYLQSIESAGRSAVASCSALKRVYRDRLRAMCPAMQFVYLKGSVELIGQQLAGRSHEFMPATLLASQLATLEEPTAGEAIVVPIAGQAPDAIVEAIVMALGRGAVRAPKA